MKKNKKRVSGNALIIGGCVLLLVAASMLGYNIYRNNKAEQAVEEVMPAMKAAIVKGPSDEVTETPQLPENKEAVASNDSPSHTASKDAGSPASQAIITGETYVDPQSMVEWPVVEIAGNQYMGFLTIPTLSLELPVMAEWSEVNLSIAPCRHYGSVETDDLVIAGHNYRIHFGSIPNLKMGDSIIFTDIEGNAIHYQVVANKKAAANEVDEAFSGKWDLTLYTCTLSGWERFVIGANRVSA